MKAIENSDLGYRRWCMGQKREFWDRIVPYIGLYIFIALWAGIDLWFAQALAEGWTPKGYDPNEMKVWIISLSLMAIFGLPVVWIGLVYEKVNRKDLPREFRDYLRSLYEKLPGVATLDVSPADDKGKFCVHCKASDRGELGLAWWHPREEVIESWVVHEQARFALDVLKAMNDLKERYHDGSHSNN